MFGRIKEIIYENKSIHKLKHCYEVELMSGTKNKYFYENREDDNLKHGLDVIYGLGYVKKITYLGMRYPK